MLPNGIRARLEETHGAAFELLRHFLARFFDSEMVTTPGEWLKVVIGLFAALASSGIIVLKMYMERYDNLSTAALYRQGMREDELSFIGLAMLITALLTALQWQSLFPGLRDSLALASLPVSPRQIFRAKFTSLLLIFGAYVLSLTVVPAMLFAMVTGGRWTFNPSAIVNIAAGFSATAGACLFTFFSLVALQGVLLHLLPVRLFERVSLAAQGIIFVGALGTAPLLGHQPEGAAWWPPTWFLGLWEGMLTGIWTSTRAAVLAMVLPAILSLLTYVLGYHRYQRLLIEGSGGPARGQGRRRFEGAGARLLALWIRDPREQAAFAFIWKTLARSRTHRVILLAYAGIAVAWVVDGLMDIHRPSLRDQGLYGFAVVTAPLAVALLTVTGLRYLFALPVTLRANWIFQTLDQGSNSAAWLAAVERFVIWFGIAPVFVAAGPVAIAILGPARAAAAMVLGFFTALLWFELMFRHWRKLPFTCTYAPGHRPVAVTLLRYGFTLPALAVMGQILLASTGALVPSAALLSFLLALGWNLRRARKRAWEHSGVEFAQVNDDDMVMLDLPEVPGGVLTSTPSTQPAAMFSGAMVESKGGISPEWAEEIAEERRHPSQLLATFFEDIRFGFRLVRRSPMLSLVVVLTLTIGIGINASVFTVVNSLALRPHVYRDPDSFVRVIAVSRSTNSAREFSYAEYTALRDQTRTVRGLAAWSMMQLLIGDDDSTGARGLLASCNFFQVDGLDRPIRGRLFTPEDCVGFGQVPPAVITEALWQSRFGADPQVLGRMVRVNNRPVQIVGIVPNRTSGWTLPMSIFMPINAITYFESSREALEQEENLWLSLAGRLAPGYTRVQAESELDVLQRRLDRSHPGRRTSIETTDGSWAQELALTLSGQRLMLMAFFMGGFYLVLLIACANVATLLLSRAAARQREIAVRLSLGAARVRLIRMLVTESLVLAGLAGIVSLWLVSRVPEPLYRWVAHRAPDFPMTTDWRTSVYIAGVVLLTGVLSGLAPALESLKVDLTAALKGGRGTPGSGGSRMRGLLVTVQVALSMILLVEAALFAESEYRSLYADPGYASRSLVIVPLGFPNSSTLDSTRARIQNIVTRMKALPGVRAVAFSARLPMFATETLELRPPARADATQVVDVFTASPDYFAALGIPLVRGREFRETDLAGVVIAQSLARAFWPNQDPVGKELTLPGTAAPLPVVGVVRDVEPLRFGGSDNPAVYRLRHIDASFNVMAVRFENAAMAQGPLVRAAMRDVEPGLMVIARVLQQWIDQVTEVLWNVVAFIVLLGLVATLLATTGIYGAVSFAVSQRLRDMGIRVALGATRWDIVVEVFRSGGRPVLQGLLAGVWLAVPMASGLRRSLEGTPLRLDTTSVSLYLVSGLLLAGAAALAIVGPARRGANADPCETLRSE